MSNLNEKILEELKKSIRYPTIKLINGYKLAVTDEKSYCIMNTENELVARCLLSGCEQMLISQIVLDEIKIMELEQKIKDLTESK